MSGPKQPPERDAGRMPRVKVLTTGGTIASRPRGADVVASDGPDELLTAVDVDGVAVQAEEIVRVGSYGIGDEELRRIARSAVVAAGANDGVVVTHGTDTMEETAFLTDLVHAGGTPIVFTGAQRHAGEADRDGPRNLNDAVRLAAHPGMRTAGVTICMAGNAWPARFATKAHTLAADAFAAPSSGPVAICHGGDVRVVARPDRPAGFALSVLDAPLPRVDVVSAYAGADGTLVRAAIEAGARGIVVAALGAGNVPPSMAKEIRAAVEVGIATVVTSRTGAGPVVPRYGGAGGGADLVRSGAILGGTLRPAHARLVLALALATAGSQAGVADLVARHG
ncbi:asparaginase [Phytoactinopolyspora halotolerans]|uniref:asparaginase n=1 Tax=Phytoactinopolyspora halotolerans TaxID=1981512 RepID=A0A6L9SFA2_9ACTN|nr:asparaginase [Phytoactinopolyspora halotolerans]NEE03733.1 asparaginase [Phytoactinopolyspora halotolerans]